MDYIALVPDDLVLSLKNSFNRGEIAQIYPDGTFSGIVRKHLVDRFQGLKVEIFSNEHPPPHFRVLHQSSSATFRIKDCSVLNGHTAILKYEKNIYLWWKKNKQKLIDTWDETRPSNCPVGRYKE